MISRFMDIFHSCPLSALAGHCTLVTFGADAINHLVEWDLVAELSSVTHTQGCDQG